MNRKSKIRECSHKPPIITAFLGIVLSLVLSNFAGLYPATVKAAETYTISVTTNKDEIAVYGNPIEDISFEVIGRNPDSFFYTLLTQTSWKKGSDYVYGNFGAGEYHFLFDLAIDKNIYNESKDYVLIVDGTEYRCVEAAQMEYETHLIYRCPVTIETSVFNVDISTDEHGTAVASPESAAAGTQITLTATPDANYRFKEWQVISGNITITNNSFTMASEDVQVRAIFETIPSGGGMSPGSGGDGNSTPGGGGTLPAPSSPDSGPSVIDTAISEIKAAKDGDTVTINSNYATNDLMNALIEKPGVTAVFIFERNGNTISVFIKNPIIENTVDIYGPENLVGIHNRCVARDFKVEQNPHMTPEEIREYVQALILDARNARMGIAPVVPVPIDDGRAGLTATVDSNGISTYASMGGGSLRYITG